MNPKTKNTKKTILTVINALVIAATLFLCMQVLSDVATLKNPQIALTALFFSLALSFILKAGLRRSDEQKKTAVYLLVMAGLFVLCGVMAIINGVTLVTVILGNIVYYGSLIANRILAISRSKKHRVISLIWNILSIIVYVVLLLLVNIVLPASPDLTEYAILMVLLVFFALPIVLQSLGHIIALSFFRLKLDVLKKIIQKTYAAEILFGMFMLIIAFSFILQLFDPAISKLSYGDALWYCFAIVTTIGFGDITATSLVGRLLSVILGIYGIIVVALITSIIVNFYSEVKSDSDDKDEENTNAPDAENEQSAEGR